MNFIINRLKKDEVLSGYMTYSPTGLEKRVKGWLEICEITDYDLEDMYNRLISDIEDLKTEYGLEIVKLERIYFKWELELLKKWNVIKIENDTIIIIADKKIENSLHNVQWIPLTYYLIEKMKTIYLDSKEFENEQKEIIEKGFETVEKEKERKFQEFKENILKILNNKSFSGFLDNQEENKKDLRVEDSESSEYVDVNSLPL